MPYLDSTTFTYLNKHRTISATGDLSGSQFTMMVNEFSSEVNRFHNATSDICSVSDSTQESFLHAKVISDLVEEKINYIRMNKLKSPSMRVEIPPPSLFDINHVQLRESLRLERREEHPKAINYNFITGRIRRWY